jgi:hypothetical protein
MPYSQVWFNGSFGGIYRLSLQVKGISQTPLIVFFMFVYCFILLPWRWKPYFLQILSYFNQATWSYMLEDRTVQQLIYLSRDNMRDKYKRMGVAPTTIHAWQFLLRRTSRINSVDACFHGSTRAEVLAPPALKVKLDHQLWLSGHNDSDFSCRSSNKRYGRSIHFLLLLRC